LRSGFPTRKSPSPLLKSGFNNPLGHCSAYHVPRPAPCLTRCPLSVSAVT
jgi:hypothetical protein